MNTDHSIKIYTTESIINIDNYKKAESQCKIAGYNNRQPNIKR